MTDIDDCKSHHEGIGRIISAFILVAAFQVFHANASVISINFVGGGVNGTPTPLGPSDSAGVVPATNWNNIAQNIASGIAGVIKDDSVSATTVNVSWTSDNTWSTQIPQTNPNSEMMKGYLDNPTHDITVVISGIPYATYDVYVYFNDDNTTTGTVGSYTIGARKIFGRDAGVLFDGTFVEANGVSATDPNANGNYVRFQALSGASFTLTAHPENAGHRSPINAIQITPSGPQQVTLDPANQSVSLGASTLFAVTAIGADTLGYQWLFNNANLSDNGRISGSQSNILTIANISSSDAGSYQVIVTNAYGSATSAVASLLVGLPGEATEQIIYNFRGVGFNDGQDPDGLLLGTDGALYGTTRSGGTDYGSFPGDGTVFRLTTNGASYAMLYSFDVSKRSGIDGRAPMGVVQGSDGALYGTTTYAPSSFGDVGDGIFFTLSTNVNSPGYAVRHYFGDGGNDGQLPFARPVLGSDGALYGTTSYGGTNGFYIGGTFYGYGTVFKLNPSGSGYGVIYNFGANDTDGQSPSAPLMQGRDGAFYGTTDSGGTNGLGTVFKLNGNGAGYSVLYSFGASTNDGQSPNAVVQGRDGALYGTTRSGGLAGTFGAGTLFKLNTNGAGYRVLHYFGAGTSDGRGPNTVVQGSDGALYGTTDSGGAHGGGTVFKVNTNGAGYTVLYSFGASAGDGQNPNTLLQGRDGAFYGTAGGRAGTVFRLILPPQITTQPTNQSVVNGGTVALAVGAAGAPPLFFQWQHNGTNLLDNSRIAGSRGNVLTIDNASSNDVGSYQVVVTNAYGSVTSAIAGLFVGPLIVLPSFQFEIAAPGNSVNLRALLATNSPNASFEWSTESGVAQPDEVLFTDPASANTTVLFGFAGTYVLLVKATQGANVFQAKITVTVGLNTNFNFPNGVFQNVSNFVNGPLLTNSDVFLLEKYVSTNLDASRYYGAIDPQSNKMTLAAWKIANGIPTNPIPAFTTNFMNGVVGATYFNSLDLGFGRRMIMKGTNGSNWAFAVNNYKTVDDAINDTNKIATVTMDYSPVGNGTTRFTKFYVYDANDRRIDSADLDHGGQNISPKYVPGLCIVCHGGTNGAVPLGVTNVHAHFLAFDLQNALAYSSNSNFTRSAQEPAFKLLNQGVLAIEQDIAQNDRSNACPAITDLIQGWYGLGLTNSVQNDNFVPSVWQDTNFTGVLSLPGQAYLYRNVVAPSCRSYHETRVVSLAPDFGSFTNFNAFGGRFGLIKTYVFGTNDITQPLTLLNQHVSPASTNTMPQARRTFQRFWNSISPRPQAEILSDYLQGTLDFYDFPAAPVITGLEQYGGDLVISFTTTSGGSYSLETATDPAYPVWTPIGGTIAGTGGIVQIIEPMVVGSSKAFYRVAAQEP
jgi:uncharacterized repeat protein (TIGR03803 family)